MKRINEVECFKIRLLEYDKLFDKNLGKTIKDISFSNNFFLKRPITIVADPFLFVKDGVLYMFYEQKRMYENGVIAMTSTVDLKNWTEPVVVLKEKCHLSYPWVFEYRGHIYMIPETCGMNSIRVYEANGTLTQFQYKTTLLYEKFELTGGFGFSDSSIYQKDGCFFLMSTINDGEKNILKLYVSDSLFGEYTEHPKSPIYIGNKYGRNAGCMIEYDRKLFRVAQDCEKSYGDNVHVIEVKNISATEYEEMPVRNYILPTDLPFYKNGGHQYNAVIFKDKYIIATDAKQYKFYFPYRVLYKIKSLLVG